MAPALRAEDVAKQYGRVQALAGVSLEVQRGELVGLLGPNGAGKSTLVKIACGLIRPSRGRAQICGALGPDRRGAQLGRAPDGRRPDVVGASLRGPLPGRALPDHRGEPRPHRSGDPARALRRLGGRRPQPPALDDRVLRRRAGGDARGLRPQGPLARADSAGYDCLPPLFDSEASAVLGAPLGAAVGHEDQAFVRGELAVAGGERWLFFAGAKRRVDGTRRAPRGCRRRRQGRRGGGRS